MVRRRLGYHPVPTLVRPCSGRWKITRLVAQASVGGRDETFSGIIGLENAARPSPLPARGSI